MLCDVRSRSKRELQMGTSRRSLFRIVAGASAMLSIGAAAGGQDPFPKPPSPMRPGEDEPNSNPIPSGKSPTKIRLEENQKDIKKDIEKLFDLASSLWRLLMMG